MEFDKGDVYVVDMSRTSGHISQITGAQWHPLERNIVLTSSIDGSVRTWDLSGKRHFGKLVCDKVFKVKNKKGQRATVSCVAYHPNGRSFVCGTKCGSIQIWDCDRLTSRPRLSVFDTHNSAEIYSISFSTDGKYFSTRGADHTVNIWQNRSLSHPVISYTNLPSYHETANCAFCPHASLICIGTSVLPGQGSSSLQIFDFLDSESHSPILQFNVEENASLVRLLWHNKLNQLFCTLSNGRFVYSSQISIYFLV